MEGFISFKRMVTPIIIQVLFWVAVVITVVVGFSMAFDSYQITSSAGVPAWRRDEFQTGLFLVFLGPLALRIYAELLIVIFRINETLTDISDQLAQPEVS